MKDTVNTASDRKKTLIRIYHTICHIRGMSNEDKLDLLSGYGAESSKDLTERQLLEIIETLQKEPDMWRRRVMAAIGAWLRSVNREDNAEVIKAIACRASCFKSFNEITVARLRDIYYEFGRKAKTSVKVKQITSDEIEILSNLN